MMKWPRSEADEPWVPVFIYVYCAWFTVFLPWMSNLYSFCETPDSMPEPGLCANTRIPRQNTDPGPKYRPRAETWTPANTQLWIQGYVIVIFCGTVSPTQTRTWTHSLILTMNILHIFYSCDFRMHWTRNPYHFRGWWMIIVDILVSQMLLSVLT